MTFTIQALDMHRATILLLSNGTITAAKMLRNWLGCLSATRHTARDADTFGKGDEFSQRLNLHFLHDPVAVSLDRALRGTQRSSGMLVGLAANNEFEDFPLAWRQFGEVSANHVQPDLPVTRHFMTRYSPFDCSKKQG